MNYKEINDMGVNINTCKDCGTKLINIVSCNLDIARPGVIENNLSGICPSCEKRWAWKEMWAIIMVSDLEEIKMDTGKEEE